MSEYIQSPQIFGAITAAVQDDAGDLAGITFIDERTLEAWQPTLIDASTSGSVVIELWTEPGGSGGVGSMLATATFNVGSTVPNSSGIIAPGLVLVGTTIYLRITAIGTDAGGLSGTVILVSSAFAGVSQQLTTSQIVKEWDPALVGTDQAVIDLAISGVSDRMVRWIGRQINQVIDFVEYPRIAPGTSVDLALNEHPAANVVVEESGSTLVVDQDYRVDADGGLLTRTSGDFPVPWPSQVVKVTYDAGYEFVPDSLVELSTWQVCAELHRQDMRLIGITQRDQEAGTTLTFDADGFLPSVKEGMKSFRRMKR